MKEIDLPQITTLRHQVSSREDLLLLNREDSEISNTKSLMQIIKASESDEIDKSLNKEIDIQSLIQKFSELPCCLNNFLEKIMKNQTRLLLEIRKRDIKIKVKTLGSVSTYNVAVCQWCMENCCKYWNLTEKEMNIGEANIRTCCCGVENHEPYFLAKKNFKLDSDVQKEIDKLAELCNNYGIEDKEKIFKEKIMNLIEGKDDEQILQIISNMLNNIFIKNQFYCIEYNHAIYSKVLSCLKESNNYSSYESIISNYISNNFFMKIRFKEVPIYVFDNCFTFNENLPALPYYYPNILSPSFFFQTYRKRILSKNIESNECISFLRKLGLTNEILCRHLINSMLVRIDLYAYGFFSLNSISKFNEKDLTDFKQMMGVTGIVIFINEICDIFSDFILNGNKNGISLMDKSNHFSENFLETSINNLQVFISRSRLQANYCSMYKNFLIVCPLFKFIFYEENKQRIITTLSSYSFSLSNQQNIFKDYVDYSEIFNSIENEVKKIANEKKLRKKNDSQQNILIVKKLLDLYQLEFSNIEELYLYDFNNLLQNLIEKDYPNKIVDKTIEIISSYNPEELESVKIYLEYILKITLLCNINIVGGAYIYNSNYISKIMKIIKQLNFNDYSNFILEMIIILKVCFNRKIIDTAFFKSKSRMIENISLKDYLIDILFINEPIIINQSLYDFSVFDRLLNRINTIYSFIFEKTNINILPESFIDINLEESYLNIIKTISLNINEEFNQMKWKNEENNLFSPIQEDKKTIEENENKLEKKIKEEIIKIKTKIPGFILLDLLRCLENLNQTNFYLKYDANSLLIDDKYALTSIILNDKLPLAVKSLLLNYLLKLVLSFKIDQKSNKIFGPLLYTSHFEKTPNPMKVKDKYLITLESNESEKHLNETIKLINILIKCIDFLKEKKRLFNFQKAFIEKNGLYDYCVSIIQALHCLSNLIVNTNKIHELYLSSFSKLAFKFVELEKIFMKIVNIEIEHNKNIFDFKKLNYRENILIAVEINRITEKYVEKINSDSYNFTDRKSTSIYQSFIDYNKGKFGITTNNHYTFILNKKKNENITLEELNEFNGIDPKINSVILNNYNKWNEYINNEYYRTKALFMKILNSKKGLISKRVTFYSFIFGYISSLEPSTDYDLYDHLFFKTLISIILSDEKFKSICEDGQLEVLLKKIQTNKDMDFSEIKARIIGQIIRKIYFLANYELLVSKCFSNTKQENELSESLNCLILFLEILGEQFNQFFHDAFFKYKFDLSIGKDNTPVAKYDEESRKFKMLKEDVGENNVYSPYEVLLELHQKIFESLKITVDNKYRETQQNNLLIIFNSLTYCIIEYANLEDPNYRPIIEKLFLRYFSWKRKDNSLNPIFQTINFEIDHKMVDKTKYIFILNNILSLFLIYIKYGTKETNKNYFWEIQSHCYIYNPYLYSFHIFIYTLQIINYLDINILNSNNCVENIIDLYKKGRFQDIELFNIVQKYHEIIFLAKKYYGYNELKYILPEYDEKRINSNKIIDYIDSGFYSDILDDIMINDDSLDEFKNFNNFIDYSKQMNIIFSFWRKIVSDIEIFIDDKKQNIYYIVRPESLFLSDYEKIVYDDFIDYSSRNSKLMSIYENLDSFLFEMIYNFYNERFNFAKVFGYFGLELMNILLFIIDNIILSIHYYKSWKEEYPEYNEIENNKTSMILLILSGIHFLYIIIVIINWFVNRLNIDYYHALSKYSIKHVKSKLRISSKIKAFKFQKLLNNYASGFSIINQFFPEFTKLKKLYILIVDTIILNPKIFPYIISLICLIFFYVFSQIFLIIPLLLIANLIPTLSAIFQGLINKIKYLIFLYSYILIILYIFSWIGFLFLPDLFKFEVVNKYNEYIVDENYGITEEYICSSSIQCILYFLNFGLSSGGALGLNLISFKNNYGHFLRQFFFEIFFYLFVNMIFSNVFLALITDAFYEMRELAWKKENDKENECFICDVSISDCINQNIEFKRHIQEHSKWKYINFICKMIMEEDVELGKEEYYIQNLMKKRSIDWFPNK